MASGQQKAEEYVLRFATWIASKTDEDFRNIASRGKLSRVEIAAECGFAKSVLAQNPRGREALTGLEKSLRKRGVLPSLATDCETEVDDETEADGETATATTNQVRQVESSQSARDAERLSRVERELASVKAENSELKRLLARFTVLQEALAETGRLPR